MDIDITSDPFESKRRAHGATALGKLEKVSRQQEDLLEAACDRNGDLADNNDQLAQDLLESCAYEERLCSRLDKVEAELKKQKKKTGAAEERGQVADKRADAAETRADAADRRADTAKSNAILWRWLGGGAVVLSAVLIALIYWP